MDVAEPKLASEVPCAATVTPPAAAGGHGAIGEEAQLLSATLRAIGIKLWWRSWQPPQASSG